MIFWRAIPDYYLEKDENELQLYEKENYQLLKEIIASFKSNKFRTSKIKYNPADDFEVNAYQILKWNISEEMIKPTRGVKPIYLGTILNFLKKKYKRSKNKRRRK